MNKSFPIYEPIRADECGRFHLLVTDRPEIAPGSLADPASDDSFDERWFIVRDSRSIPSVDGAARDQAFRAEEHLLIALRDRLSRERMGLRLYAIGAEPFVWATHGVGQASGLGRSEMRLFAVAPKQRRVYCNHCRTITEGVETTIAPCSGCGAALLVRDHFSRRMNAFAGVQVDAEEPGEIPAAERLYS